jgi:hypothetical protein
MIFLKVIADEYGAGGCGGGGCQCGVSGARGCGLRVRGPRAVGPWPVGVGDSDQGVSGVTSSVTRGPLGVEGQSFFLT